MVRENEKIRRAARASGVPLWAAAQKIGVSEPTLTRWLRTPLPTEKEWRIMAAIQELSGEVG